jgi:hypothetical protein
VDGTIEGTTVGRHVGIIIGINDGEMLGICVGACVGIIVGARLGLSVRVILGKSFRDVSSKILKDMPIGRIQKNIIRKVLIILVKFSQKLTEAETMNLDQRIKSFPFSTLEGRT